MAHCLTTRCGNKTLPFAFEMRGDSIDSWWGSGIESAMELGISVNYKN